MKKNAFMYQMLFSRLRLMLFVILFMTCFIQKNNGQVITMPNIIGSGMVLQQNTQVPIWGWATAGTNVEINASWGQTVSTTSASNGKWMTKIQTPVALAGQAPVYSLTITGPSNTISFTNILVGEVWLCSGQSNMWFPMKYVSADMLGVVDNANEIAAANFPNIRLFTVPTLDAVTPAVNCNGTWSSCTPASVASFSAVAYYFGREIYNNAAVNVPIGLINDSYSGSSIQAWIKDSILQNDAVLKTKYIDKNYSTSAVYLKPSLLYNAMIAPIIPYAIKGVLWYQGESNVGNDASYTKANIALINDWRASWGRDFSFYAVQITPRFSTATQKDITTDRGFFREFQTNIMTAPRTGIIVTSDLLLNAEERLTAHPRNKKDVGHRLALWALAKDYAQQIQHIGPMYQSYSIEGNKVRITFKPESLGGGLTTSDGLYPRNFWIAGSNKTYFYPALAIIEGNTIVVSSPYVTTPISVRYSFTDGSMTNLTNKEGLPAYQFRTDLFDQYYLAIPFIDMVPPTALENTRITTSKLFPNPFHDYLNIDGIQNGIQKIEIYDIMGRKVKSQNEDNASTARVNVSDLLEGAYELRILQKDKAVLNFKIIKD